MGYDVLGIMQRPGNVPEASGQAAEVLSWGACSGDGLVPSSWAEWGSMACGHHTRSSAGYSTLSLVSRKHLKQFFLWHPGMYYGQTPGGTKSGSGILFSVWESQLPLKKKKKAFFTLFHMCC